MSNSSNELKKLSKLQGSMSPFSLISLIILHTSSSYTIPHFLSHEGGEFYSDVLGEKLTAVYMWK